MGLPALADKLRISVETSKTNIFGWYFLTSIGPFKSDNTLSLHLLIERIMALQQVIDKKNTLWYIY